MSRPLLFGGGVALLGAVAWGLLVFYAHREFGLLAWGIGAAIGAAMVKGGAHGTMLAVVAGVLALASIGTGKQIAFQLIVDQQSTKMVSVLSPELHAEQAKDAKDWVALGADVSDEQVKTFIAEHGYEGPPADFRREMAPKLVTMAREQPSLEQWREDIRKEFFGAASFFDYLREDFHLADILFVVLGIASAFGLVSKATAELRVAARQQLRAEREAQPPTAAS
jgi:hypothetical protein